MVMFRSDVNVDQRGAMGNQPFFMTKSTINSKLIVGLLVIYRKNLQWDIDQHSGTMVISWRYASSSERQTQFPKSLQIRDVDYQLLGLQSMGIWMVGYGKSSIFIHGGIKKWDIRTQADLLWDDIWMIQWDDGLVGDLYNGNYLTAMMICWDDWDDDGILPSF